MPHLQDRSRGGFAPPFADNSSSRPSASPAPAPRTPVDRLRAVASRVALVSVALTLLLQFACVTPEAAKLGDPKHPLGWHPILPSFWPSTGQIAAGRANGFAPPQPIGFSHKLHAGEMKIDCQYCHSEARRSAHAGVPPLQTCMGCHSQIRKDSPEVQKIHLAWCGKPECTVAEDANGQPVADPSGQGIEWNKVHDLPDYVVFNHSRHVTAGVNCTECHGQVQLQGEYKLVPIPGGPEGAVMRQVDAVMVREATLQMGFCLNCHATHPSVDQNYGEAAPLRRAELKDCWTCHK